MRAVYEITNSKRFWPSLSVSLAELDGAEGFARQPQCYLLHAAAGMTASVPADLLPKRRGLHELNRYQLGTGFPFGFVKRAVINSHSDRVLIYPALAAVDRRLVAMCRAAELSGATVRPQPGGADEFYGVKEFRSGENRRLIYWRRSRPHRNPGFQGNDPRRSTAAAPACRYLSGRADHSIRRAGRASHRHGRLARVGGPGRGDASGARLLERALARGCAARGKQQRTEILSAFAPLSSNHERELSELLEECHSLIRPGVTPVLFTPRNVQLGLIEEARGAMLVISSSIASAQAYFRFDPGVNFRSCMPAPFKAKII